MIIELYTFLIFITLALLFLGYYAKVDTLKVIGYGIFFILAAFLFGIGGSLEYKTGETINNNMACGGCVDSRFINSTNATNFYVASTSEIYTYSIYENQTLGFFLTLIGFLGWLSVYFDYIGRRKE